MQAEAIRIDQLALAATVDDAAVAPKAPPAGRAEIVYPHMWQRGTAGGIAAAEALIADAQALRRAVEGVLSEHSEALAALGTQLEGSMQARIAQTRKNRQVLYHR